MIRINIGCGMTPTPGWRNFDNSISLRLAARPLLLGLVRRLGLLKPSQLDYIAYCQKNQIEWADATRHIPLDSGSVEVVYASHMFEHLDRQDATAFLKEAHRVLAPGGVLRLVVPDLRTLCEAYATDGDADKFIASSLMCVPRPRGLVQTSKALIVGERHHQWMYDGRSLCRRVEGAGFVSAASLRPGETRITDPGTLDLHERDEGSAYVEATRP